jgi:hypothetical protein
MLRIVMSSIMRWRSGEICFVTGVLLSVRMRERPILTGRDVIDEMHFPA